MCSVLSIRTFCNDGNVLCLCCTIQNSMPTILGSAGLQVYVSVHMYLCVGVCVHVYVCVCVRWISNQGSATELMSFPGNTYILFPSEWQERLIAGHKLVGRGGR